jgi:hypothetical protein
MEPTTKHTLAKLRLFIPCIKIENTELFLVLIYAILNVLYCVKMSDDLGQSWSVGFMGMTT